MSYAVSLNLTGQALLLGLVNHDNGTDLQAQYVTLVRPPTPLVDDIRNTMTTITTTDPEYIDGVDAVDVEVKYNRIDIANLWSLVTLQVREIELDVVDGVVTINNKINTEIKRRYGVTIADEDFAITRDGEGRLWLNARADSLGYIGTREIRVIKSLSTVVAQPLLGGFHAVLDEGKPVLVPNEAYPIGSYFHSSNPSADPATTVGGEWEKVPTIALTGDQLHFYSQPVGFGFTLMDEFVIPESEAYSYIKRKANDPYNDGKATTVDVNGTTMLRITDANSSLNGQDIPLADDATGYTTYMMVSKASGALTSASVPQYSWKRTA